MIYSEFGALYILATLGGYAWRHLATHLATPGDTTATLGDAWRYLATLGDTLATLGPFGDARRRAATLWRHFGDTSATPWRRLGDTWRHLDNP